MPVSRILFPDKSGSSSFICDDDCSSPVAPNPSASREQRSNTDIRGLTIRKVYPTDTSLNQPVCSYHTFSPLLRRAVIFCGTFSIPVKERPDVIGMRCSVLSGLSSSITQSDEAACDRRRK